MTDKIPQGYHTITPSLNIENAKEAVEHYKKAFGATLEGEMMQCPDTGKIMHAEMKIGDSKIMIADIMPGCPMGATHSAFCVYLPDADAAYKKATAAGCESLMEPQDMFWGDRMGTVKDPYGNAWSFATRMKAMSQDEIRKAARDWMQSQKKAA